ncbi:Uncharacterised protein r2_g2631 [Pycnogonum litorale]
MTAYHFTGSSITQVWLLRKHHLVGKQYKAKPKHWLGCEKPQKKEMSGIEPALQLLASKKHQKKGIPDSPGIEPALQLLASKKHQKKENPARRVGFRLVIYLNSCGTEAMEQKAMKQNPWNWNC